MALPLAEHLSPELETALIHRCHVMPAAGHHWLCGRRRACSQHISVYQRACNAFSTTLRELPTSPWPYAVIGIKRGSGWLAGCQLVSSKARTGWMAAFADFSLSGTRETIFS
jgi:hypothetical protein